MTYSDRLLSLQLDSLEARRVECDLIFYTVSQKKTSPTFLAMTRESIDGFL